jgi:hypothetical protein
MERIKRAIEQANDAKKGRAEQNGASSAQAQTKVVPITAYSFRVYLIKVVIASLLIIFAGWLWMHFDFKNRLELMASEYISDGIRQAHAEANRRMANEAKFNQLILDNLNHCQLVAEKDRDNYVKLVGDSVRIKNKNTTSSETIKTGTNSNRYIIPKDALAEANEMMEASKLECKQIYDLQLKNGK